VGVARVACQCDAEAHQRLGSRPIDSAGGETVERCLIGRRRGHGGTCGEERGVHGLDFLGGIQE
jgi:hypothetical protein